MDPIRHSKTVGAFLHGLVALLVVTGCGASASSQAAVDVVPSGSISGTSPATATDTPLPSENASETPSDSYLRLDIMGLPIFYDKAAYPPIVEVTPIAITFVDLAKGRDPSRLAQLERIMIDYSTFDRILKEARDAGVVGSKRYWDHDDDVLNGIGHTLTIVENGVVTANVFWQGVVTDNESGPDATVRISLWNFVNRLFDPVEAYATTNAVAYAPNRLVVFADALDPSLIGDMNIELLDWTVTDQPSEWTVARQAEGTLGIPGGNIRCRVFTGAEAAAVRAALAPLPLGRAWLDIMGSPWAMIARPVTASEPSPCD